MPQLFRKLSTTSCFFCNSPITPAPRNPRKFRCQQCNCLNHFDEKGEIISDEPAMHDEAFNARSFAKRAAHSKDRLPTHYGKGPFCHDCQTNQMLIINLLSNYLPSPENPGYDARLASLPEYQQSLNLRYPPVCEKCLPVVEEEIRVKNEMARTKALGGWLKESKGKAAQRKVHKPSERNVWVEWVVWRLRGVLWSTSLAIALAGDFAVAFSYPIPPRLTIFLSTLPALVLLSTLWTAWDPTYRAYRKAQSQGRGVRLKGKNDYINLQMLAWASRFLTSILLAMPCYWPHLDYLQTSRRQLYFTASLALELFCLITSALVLRLQHPAPIRLIDTSTHLHSFSRGPTPAAASVPERPATSHTPAEPDLFSALTLSSRPIISPPPSAHPIFGLPSLVPGTPPSPVLEDRMDEDEDGGKGVDVDAMDVDVPSPDKSRKGKAKQPAHATTTTSHDDGSWLRPQRFFAPERPTGLEGLFAKTQLLDEADHRSRSAGGSGRDRRGARMWMWGAVVTALVVLLAGVVYQVREWRVGVGMEGPVELYDRVGMYDDL